MMPTHRFPKPLGPGAEAGQDARRGRGAIGLLAAAAFASAVLGALPAAAQQHCVDNQAQLRQAIDDSQRMIASASTTLDRFAAALIAPRTGPLDAEPVVSARGQIDAYIAALSDFSAQVSQIGQGCGPQFAADGQTLSALISDFERARARAEQLLEEQRALASSGEPPMTQAQMEAVQRALSEQGHYQAAIDGRFGAGTRSAIAAWQTAIGREGTGYLTPDEFAQLLAQPATPEEAGDGDVAASALPPAPPADDDGTTAVPPPGTGAEPLALSDEASRICTQNTEAVEDAVRQARTFREGMRPRLNAYRDAILGPRIPAIDTEEAGRMAAETNAFLDPMENFHDQAESVVGQCGGGFDESYESLGAQIASLRGLVQEIGRARSTYEELIASGEPAMDEEAMRAVQAGLHNLGHYDGRIDALFGSGTRSAIQAYQASVGAEQTGYLSAEQIAALRLAAERPPEPPEPETPAATPPGDAPEPPAADAAEPPAADAAVPPPEPSSAVVATTSGTPQVADVRRILFAEIARRPVAEPLSGLGAGDGRLGDLWWQAREDVAQGRPQEAVDGRLALFGAAYLDRGAESPAMADAHLLVGEAFARIGLHGDAAFHFQRAYDIWSGLGREDSGGAALLQERLATARLAEAVANGTVGGARFDDVLRLLDAARSAGGSSAAALDRMADLFVAAGREPSDPEIAAAIRDRYGS